jgi:hypothetical protein
LAFGDGDAAGDGLGLFPGTLTVAVGEGDVDSEGLALFGEVELSTDSVAQPTANTIENVVRSNIAVRLIMCMFGVLIDFCLAPARLKSETIIAQLVIGSNGCSHRGFRGISAWSIPKPSFSKACLHDKRTRGNKRGRVPIGPIRHRTLGVVPPLII